MDGRIQVSIDHLVVTSRCPPPPPQTLLRLHIRPPRPETSPPRRQPGGGGRTQLHGCLIETYDELVEESPRDAFGQWCPHRFPVYPIRCEPFCGQSISDMESRGYRSYGDLVVIASGLIPPRPGSFRSPAPQLALCSTTAVPLCVDAVGLGRMSFPPMSTAFRSLAAGSKQA